MKPDYRLKVFCKRTEHKCNDAGAGWKNTDGSISIVLAPGICLQQNKDHFITLFPTKEKKNE